MHIQGRAASRCVFLLADLREIMLPAESIITVSAFAENSIYPTSGAFMQLVAVVDGQTKYYELPNAGKTLSFSQPCKLDSLYVIVEQGESVDTVIYPQIEFGAQRTEFTPYRSQFYPADERGNIADIPAEGSSVTVSAAASGITLHLSYQADTKGYIDWKFKRLEQAILATGGMI